MDATLDYIEKRGEKRGEKYGEKRGLDLAAELYQILASKGQIDEWNEAVKNKDKMLSLLREHALTHD